MNVSKKDLVTLFSGDNTVSNANDAVLRSGHTVTITVTGYAGLAGATLTINGNVLTEDGGVAGWDSTTGSNTNNSTAASLAELIADDLALAVGFTAPSNVMVVTRVDAGVLSDVVSSKPSNLTVVYS